MAGSDKTVKVRLIAEAAPYVKGTTEASAATRKLGKDIEATEAKSKNAGSAFGKASGALKGMAVAGAAVAGTALVGFLSDAVSAAGDLEQSIGGVDAVFGDAAQKVHDFGKTSAESVGLSTNSFNELVTLTGALLKNKGLEDFADKSLDLVKIGADLSATYGGTAKEAVEALNAAMRGEGNPIERYGITINQTAIQAELAAKGLDKLTGSALEQAKAQASIDIITRQSADALGKFASEADTLQGQQQRLNAKWEDAKAEIGAALLPALTSVVEVMSKGVDVVVAAVHAWDQIPGPIKAAVGALIAFRVAQGPIGKGLGVMIDTLKSLREALAFAVQSAGRAGGGFKGLSAGVQTFTGSAGLAKGAMAGMKTAGSALMGLAGGPWGLAITGLTVAITGYFQAQENARKAAEGFAETLDKTTGKFTEQSRELARNNFFKDFAQEDYSKVSGSLEKAGVGIGNLIAAYEKGGPAVEDFKNKFDEWRHSQEAIDLARQGVNIEALGNSYAALGRDMQRGADIAKVNADAQKETEKATGDAGDAAKQATPPVDRYADILKKVQEESKKGRDLQKELASAMLEVKAAAGDADAAAIAYQQSLDDATASVKENGKTLDINTEKGRNNMSALLDLKDAALASAEANLKNGDDITVVKGQMDSARESFIKVAMQMNGGNRKAAEALATKYGLTRDSVDQLKGSMDKIPKEVTSKLKADTSQAQRRVAELQALLTGDWLRDRTVRIVTIYEERGSTAARLAAQSRDSRRSRVVGGYADGGLIAGPGTSTSDSIPALLSDGEYVVKAAAVAKYGAALLHDINAMRFADGGYVSRAAATAPAASAASLGPVTASLDPEDRALLQAVAGRPVEAQLILDGRQAGRIVAAGARANGR